MPVIELAFFSASETFIADCLNTANPAFSGVTEVEGCINAYCSVQSEDTHTGYLAIFWEIYEHHKKLTEDPSYPSLKGKLLPCIAGDLKLQHIKFDVNIDRALSAPTTEFATFKVKPGESTEDLLSRLKALSAKLDKSCYAPSIWGESREHPGTFVLVVGWDSKEAHEGAVATDSFRQLISDIAVNTDTSLVHVDLKNYSA